MARTIFFIFAMIGLATANAETSTRFQPMSAMDLTLIYESSPEIQDALLQAAIISACGSDEEIVNFSRSNDVGELMKTSAGHSVMFKEQDMGAVSRAFRLGALYAMAKGKGGASALCN